MERFFERSSFIIFNYDRCVEHFFAYALAGLYNINLEYAYQIIATAKFYHPYGVPGPLNEVQFAQTSTDLFSDDRDIKTYTEAVDDPEVRKSVLYCERIIFLGFAFHPQNMEILAKPQTLHQKQILGTILDASDSDADVISGRIKQWFNAPIAEPRLVRATASEFMDYFARTL